MMVSPLRVVQVAATSRGLNSELQDANRAPARKGRVRGLCGNGRGMSRLGLEPTDASGMNDNDLRQPPQEGAAKSGAVTDDPTTNTLESLAAALLALQPVDRAR